MAGSSRIVGIIFLVVGVAAGVLATAFIGVSLANGSIQTAGGAVLGITICGVVPMLFSGGFGIYLFMRGRAEALEMAEIRRRERLLGLIQAQGQVSLSTLMIELKMARQEIKEAIYDLVNLGLFAGYIDWNKQTFYSQDAARVGSNKCPNCGGVRELVGKGIVKCPYCGVELFIPPDTAQPGSLTLPPSLRGGV